MLYRKEQITLERIDEVNDKLKLIQNTDGLTFGTDALLLAGYISGKYKDGCELGGGTGIISMLLLTREKVGNIKLLEVQEEYAELSRKNAELNSLCERLIPVHTDIRDYKSDREFDIVFSNPPYMKTSSGKANILDKKNISRHEVCGDITDFCKSGARLLKFGGIFAAVYRPDRLTDIIAAMRTSGLEPKRMTFVYADTRSESSMVLIEAKKGAKSGIMLTMPLIIYEDNSHTKYSYDMNYIMENGSFPDYYKR